uniref:Major facilitator superfamily (MFS) profile domain-containing protein n=1 Tax=Magallana gigas TaxID=29159 RepID=A0A8W8K7A1_MAGGI
MAATERVLLLALVFRNIFAYDNLALNRPSSFEPFQTAAPGNDGNPSSCITMSPTATSVARFVVEFASSRTIQEVNVTFPSGGTGMEGFFISISNSSELDSGYICYRSKLNVIPPSSNTYPCVGTGNYLTVYNRQRDGPIDFDICEVAVTGCSYQRFGYECSQTCSCPGECHFETGECITPISVCNITGRWGENCNEVCGFCKDGAACDMSTGSCPAGCSAGYRTSKCTVECIGGTFGEDCQKSCGQCKNSRCNPVTGECDNTGCNTGYIGASCFNSNTFYNNQNGATSLAWQGNVATGSINYNGQILTDERLSSCVYQAAAFTNTIGSSSVQVTLTKERMIRELVLSHYPEGVTGPTLSNMAGFKILISNGVTVKDCFNWTSSDVPKQLQTVTCVGLAKVITIINTRSIGTTYPSAWGLNPGLAFCEIAAIGLFVTVFLIERIGRKFTMVFEFFVFGVFVLLANICTSRPVLTFFLFVARAFISGAFQAAYVYTPEVYPTSMRAIGLGSCSMMARIGAIVTPFVAQVLLKESSYLAISTYGVISIVATGAAILLPIETKGKEMK